MSKQPDVAGTMAGEEVEQNLMRRFPDNAEYLEALDAAICHLEVSRDAMREQLSSDGDD